MKITGVSIIKDAIIYDYPVVESIQSILPICDEVIVAVGKSNDETLELVKKIKDKKIKIIETTWDEENRTGGTILSNETNKALSYVSKDTDWIFYIQADEVIHEKYLEVVRRGMKECKDDDKIDGLLFNYLHFYGSYDYVAVSSGWYQEEIRVVKNNRQVYSYGDAQGFRKQYNKKLNVCAIDAYINHYGWVRAPKSMQKKQIKFNSFWHDDEWLDKNIPKVERYDYNSSVHKLIRFEETHPQVIQKRIKTINWEFKYDISYSKFSLKDKVKRFLLKYLGINFYYTNYKLKKKLNS